LLERNYIYLQSMNDPVKSKAFLLAAFAVETLGSTWCLKLHGWAPFFSVLYFLSGIVIAVALLRLPELRLPAIAAKPWRGTMGRGVMGRSSIWRCAILIGLIALALYSWCLYWFDEIPIDINNADMLPIIKVMAGRFLAGQHSHVYDPIPAIWHGVQPIYLPAMWLPYVPAVAMGIDMRWVAIAGLLFAFGAFIVLYKPSGSRSSFFLGVLAFLLFWWVVADNTPGLVSVSEEGVVIGYYALLVLALVSGKPWLTGIAISLDTRLCPVAAPPEPDEAAVDPFPDGYPVFCVDIPGAGGLADVHPSGTSAAGLYIICRSGLDGQPRCILDRAGSGVVLWPQRHRDPAWSVDLL
jgi:hypothetical protein